MSQQPSSPSSGVRAPERENRTPASAPRVLLDGSAGLPTSPAAPAALTVALDRGWADPTGLHHESRAAAALLEAARGSLAEAFGVRSEQVHLRTSGADALDAAIRGLLAGRSRVGRRLVVGAVERESVLAATRTHEREGGSAAVVGVDAWGRVDAEAFVAAATAPGTAVAVLQAANQEVGTSQPVGEVGAALAGSGVPLVVDVAPLVGRTALPAAGDAMAADARLWGGPPGIGVLVLRPGARWRPAPGLPRAETRPVPVPLAVAAAAALEQARRGAAEESARLEALVDRIRDRVAATVPDAVVHGDPVDRLPHVVTFSCLYVDGETLLLELDRLGFVVGSGSACTTEDHGPSHVLAAMGALTQGNLRLALPPGTLEADVERFLGVLPGVVAAVRERAGVVGL